MNEQDRMPKTPDQFISEEAFSLIKDSSSVRAQLEGVRIKENDLAWGDIYLKLEGKAPLRIEVESSPQEFLKITQQKIAEEVARKGVAGNDTLEELRISLKILAEEDADKEKEERMYRSSAEAILK
jgi:hypothetical protein